MSARLLTGSEEAGHRSTEALPACLCMTLRSVQALTTRCHLPTALPTATSTVQATDHQPLRHIEESKCRAQFTTTLFRRSIKPAQEWAVLLQSRNRLRTTLHEAFRHSLQITVQAHANHLTIAASAHQHKAGTTLQLNRITVRTIHRLPTHNPLLARTIHLR